KSSFSAARSASTELYQRAPGRRSASAARPSSRTSAAATNSTSGQVSHPGRCPLSATLPTPTIAPLSIAAAGERRRAQGERRRERKRAQSDSGGAPTAPPFAVRRSPFAPSSWEHRPEGL